MKLIQPKTLGSFTLGSEKNGCCYEYGFDIGKGR